MANIILSPAGGGYGSAQNYLIAGLIAENDTRPEKHIVLSSKNVNLVENSSKTFDVSLSQKPSDDVKVTISGHGSTNLAPDPLSLTFTPDASGTDGSWADAQAVTLSASEDNNFSDETVTLTLTTSGGDYGNITAEIEVTITDNDVAVGNLVVTHDYEKIWTMEEGETRQIKVKLSEAPQGTDVTVTPISVATRPVEHTFSPSSLVFTGNNWNVDQTLDITAYDDDEYTGPSRANIILSPAGGGYGSAQNYLIAGLIAENDDPPLKKILVVPEPLTVNEGESKDFTVALSSQPTGTVTVNIPVFANPTLTRDESTLIFTTSNYSAAQIVIVSATEDDDADDENETITLSASGGGYDNVTQDVRVYVDDNEVQHPTEEVSSVQFIQNIVGSDVDLYINDSRYLDDFSPQSATSMGRIEAGKIRLDVVPADAENNNNPLFSKRIDLVPDSTYQIILQGQGTDKISALVLGDDQGYIPEDVVEIRVIHGASNLEQIDIQILEYETNRNVIAVLGSRMDYGEVGSYVSFPSQQFNVVVYESSNGSVIEVYAMDWSESSKRRGLLILSGSGSSPAEGLIMMGVWQNGNTYFPRVVTSVQDLPVDIALGISVAVGNFPNPFVDKTCLWFNLQETAEVEVKVIDVLGRTIFSNVVGRIAKGGPHQYEINTIGWPSGVYFYQVMTSTDRAQEISTGKMMRVK